VGGGGGGVERSAGLVEIRAGATPIPLDPAAASRRLPRCAPGPRLPAGHRPGRSGGCLSCWIQPFSGLLTGPPLAGFRWDDRINGQAAPAGTRQEAAEAITLPVP